MSKISVFILALLASILAACSSGSSALNAPSPVPPTPLPQATPTQETKILRTYYPPAPNMVDIPYLLTLDSLRAMGYDVETTTLGQIELLTAALAKGDLDISEGSSQTMWTAIGKGSPIRAIVGEMGNPFYVYARPSLKSCADLSGKSLSLPATTGVVPMMLDQYVAKNCPGTKIQLLPIPSSGARIPALISGQTDASVLQLDTVLQLERQAPGQFKELISFEEAFPQVIISAYYVNRDFGAKHPEQVKDFIRAILQADRRVQDKPVLKDAVHKYLSFDNATTDAAVDAYLAENMWDVNGQLSAENIQATVAFLAKGNVIPDNVKPEDVADLSYLQAVLAEIGRK